MLTETSLVPHENPQRKQRFSESDPECSRVVIQKRIAEPKPTFLPNATTVICSEELYRHKATRSVIFPFPDPPKAASACVFLKGDVTTPQRSQLCLQNAMH